jgi:hypothetical protein
MLLSLVFAALLARPPETVAVAELLKNEGKYHDRLVRIEVPLSDFGPGDCILKLPAGRLLVSGGVRNPDLRKGDWAAITGTYLRAVAPAPPELCAHRIELIRAPGAVTQVPPKELQGKWYGTYFSPEEYGRFPNRFTLQIEKDALTLGEKDAVFVTGTVATDPAKKLLDLKITAGKWKGATVLGSYKVSGEDLEWTALLPGDEKIVWTFRAAAKGPPVKVTFDDLVTNPEKYGGKLIELEGVTNEPKGNEVSARVTYWLEFDMVGKKRHIPIDCDGEPTVKKGDRARLVGRFRHDPHTFVPMSITVFDPDCSVVKIPEPKKP